MFDLKISGIIAGAAFILSFLIGLISGTSMPMAIVRPLIFGILFFVITALINLAVSRFLPELTEDSRGDAPLGLSGTPDGAGSRVNITLDDSEDSGQNYSSGGLKAAVPGAADESDEGLGDIADLLRRGVRSGEEETRTGMDQNAKDGYTGTEGFGDFSLPGAESPGKPAASSGGISNSMEVLPDLDSMAGAFIPAATEDESDTTEYSVSAPVKKSSSRDKAPAWTEDFNAKEIAAGLRTVLKRDKEG